MGIQIPGFHPTDVLKKVIEHAEHVGGAVVDGAEKVVGNALSQVPHRDQVWDAFERGASAAGKALGVPGFSSHPEDARFDGQFLNPQNPSQPLPPNTPLDQVPALLPQNGRKIEDTVVFVNGMGEDAPTTLRTMQALANTGLKVIGLHNGTQGQASDLLQAAGDEIDTGSNAAVTSMRDLIVDRLSHGQSLHLAAHSHGGVIVARAIRDAVPVLKEKLGLDDAQVRTLLGNLKVEDFGTAGHQFVDGPRYVHYASAADNVPNAVGVTAPGAHDGAGGKIHVLPWNPAGGMNPFKSHDFNNFYSAFRRPFDEAYADSQRYDQPYQVKPGELESAPGPASLGWNAQP